MPALSVLVALIACGPEEPDRIWFDQEPEISVEAGESVNVSVSASREFEDPSLVWEASCGQVMGLTRRGSYVAPDAPASCAITATLFADPTVSATLAVQVTPASGGGATRWTRHLASDYDEAVRALAPTDDGGVVALLETSGDLAGPPQGNLDVAVLRLDAAGELRWAHPIATETREFAGGLTVAADGTIWAVGSTWGALGGAPTGESDAFVVQLSADGERLETWQFGSARADTAQGVVVDAEGALTVVGWTEGALGAPSAGGPDAYVRRLTPDGDALWTTQIGGSGIDFAIALALDGADTVIAGTTDGQVGAPSGGGLDWYVARVDVAGALVGVTQGGAALDDRAYALAARPGGGVALAGASGQRAFVTAFDTEDRPLWTHTVDSGGEDFAQSVTVSPEGDLWVAGFTSGDLGTPNVGFFDAFVQRLDAAGELEWTRRIGSAADDYAWSIVATADDALVVGGRTDGGLAEGWGLGGDGFVRKLER